MGQVDHYASLRSPWPKLTICKFLCRNSCVPDVSAAQLVPDMEWLQGHNPMAGDFGCRTRDVPVRSYVAFRDLTKMSTSWETIPEFKEYLDAVEEFAPPPQPAAKRC